MHRPVCLPTHSDAGDSLAGLEVYNHLLLLMIAMMIKIKTMIIIPKVLASGWGRPKDNATGISPVLREVDEKLSSPDTKERHQNTLTLQISAFHLPEAECSIFAQLGDGRGSMSLLILPLYIHYKHSCLYRPC